MFRQALFRPINTQENNANDDHENRREMADPIETLGQNELGGEFEQYAADAEYDPEPVHCPPSIRSNKRAGAISGHRPALDRRAELFQAGDPATNIILNVGSGKHSEAFEGAPADMRRR